MLSHKLVPIARFNLSGKIISYLKDRSSKLEDTCTSGKSLKGKSYKGIWRYRVENYRILCKIEDDKLTVLVVAVGHRSKIYD